MDAIGDEVVGGHKKDRRTWTNEEMLALLDCLEEHVRKGDRNNNGQFKLGTTKDIEGKLNEIFPNCELKSDPHIASAMKKLKTQHHFVTEMLNLSGFCWNEVAKCVECDSDNAWHSYVKREPRAKGFRNKKLPYLERLLGIFGNDRSNGQNSITMADSRVEVDREEQAGQAKNNIEIEGSSINQEQHSLENTLARKKARIGEKLAAVISDLGNKLFDALDRSSARVDKLGESIKAAIDNITNDKMYEDQRRVMDELNNMDLTRNERVRAATNIMATLQQIHIFWGSKRRNDMPL